MTFQNIQLSSDDMISITRSDDVEIFQSTFQNITANHIYLSTSSIYVYLSKFFGGAAINTIFDKRALVSENSNIVIVNSFFRNLSSSKSGGAILMENGNLMITDSSFQNNSASEGGSLALLCSKSAFCTYQIDNSIFTQSRATVQGGSIYYNKYKPQLNSLNFFDQSNYAPYGVNFASYPYSVRVLSYEANDVASGQNYDGIIKFEVIDSDGQRVNNDQESTIMISTSVLSQNTDIIGQKQVKVINGVGNLTDLTFISKPTSQNVAFNIHSANINKQYIEQIFSVDQPNDINDVNIYLNFRDCKRGEILTNDRCDICPLGTYSLLLNATSCFQCPDNALCDGGDHVDALPAYWRSSYNSTNLLECFIADACIGGAITEDYNYSTDTMCATGYGDYMCNKCQTYGDIKYSRVSKNKCAQCPSAVVNFLLLLVIFIAIFGYLSILIYLNLKISADQTQGKDVQVIMRIMTNYIQIIATASALNLNWPDQLLQFFQLLSYPGDSVENLLSIDCMVESIYPSNDSPFYFKTMMYCFLPLMLMSVYYSYFGIYCYWKKLGPSALTKRLAISLIMVIYMFHPTITKYAFAIFFCIEPEPGVVLLQEDLQVQCWTGDHMRLCLALGIPMLLVYVYGIPLTTFFFLRSRKDKLESPSFQQYWARIYQGLKTQYYYWEFINILRKVFLVSINVFLQNQKEVFKAMVAVTVLSVVYRVQISIQPYKNEIINQLEERELLASLMTFCGALFFVNSDFSEGERMLALIFIICSNLWFFTLWIYCMLTQYTKWYLSSYFLDLFSYLSMIKYTKDLTVQIHVKPTKESQQFSSNATQQKQGSKSLTLPIIKSQEYTFTNGDNKKEQEITDSNKRKEEEVTKKGILVIKKDESRRDENKQEKQEEIQVLRKQSTKTQKSKFAKGGKEPKDWIKRMSIQANLDQIFIQHQGKKNTTSDTSQVSVSKNIAKNHQKPEKSIKAKVQERPSSRGSVIKEEFKSHFRDSSPKEDYFSATNQKLLLGGHDHQNSDFNCQPSPQNSFVHSLSNTPANLKFMVKSTMKYDEELDSPETKYPFASPHKSQTATQDASKNQERNDTNDEEDGISAGRERRKKREVVKAKSQEKKELSKSPVKQKKF